MYARKNIHHVCPFRIEKSDPRARCVAGNSASLVTWQRRCPRVGFIYPEREHMTDIINIIHPHGYLVMPERGLGVGFPPLMSVQYAL